MAHSYYGRGYINSHATSYSYGWPSGGASQPDVLDQWTFSEASGPIVSKVVGTSVAAAGSGHGYGTAVPYGVTPGITGNATGCFRNAGADTSLDLDQSDYTLEWWWDSQTKSNASFFGFDSGTTGYNLFLNTNGTTVFRINHYVYAEADATQVLGLWNIGAGFFDGTTRKSRITVDRSGNAELFIDGVTQGTVDYSGMEIKDIKCKNLAILGSSGGTSILDGSMYELRISKNLTNNSGGPGGG